MVRESLSLFILLQLPSIILIITSVLSYQFAKNTSKQKRNIAFWVNYGVFLMTVIQYKWNWKISDNRIVDPMNLSNFSQLLILLVLFLRFFMLVAFIIAFPIIFVKYPNKIKQIQMAFIVINTIFVVFVIPGVIESEFAQITRYDETQKPSDEEDEWSSSVTAKTDTS